MTLTIVFAGCSAATPPVVPAPSGAPASSAADQPKYGGRLNLRVIADLNDFDCSTSSKRICSYGSPAVSHLLGFKSGPDLNYADLVLKPELAERWEVSPDATQFTFYLRKGVQFAGSGKELTAQEAKFSLEYASRTGAYTDPKLGKAQFEFMMEGVDRVEAPDPGTVIVRFKQPFAPFLQYAGSRGMPVLPKEIFDQDGNFKNRNTGTGPYQLDKAASQTGTRWVWKKNAAYWDPGKPYIDEVYQLVLKDDNAAWAAFQTRQLDAVTENVGTRDAEELRKKVPAAVVKDYSNPEAEFTRINVRPGSLLANETLRKAISSSIDRDEFLKTFEGGSGEWALAGGTPSTLPQSEVRKIIPYNSEEAKKQLTTAGYPNGVDIEFIYPGADYGDDFLARTELLQAQLKKTGVRLNLKAVDATELTLRRRNGNFAMIAGSGGFDGDIDSLLFANFAPASSSNAGGVDDPALTKLLNAQRSEPAPAKRADLIAQSVRYVNEHVYGISTYYGKAAQLWHPYFKGYYPNWGNPAKTYIPYLTEVWLDK